MQDPEQNFEKEVARVGAFHSPVRSHHSSDSEGHMLEKLLDSDSPMQNKALKSSIMSDQIEESCKQSIVNAQIAIKDENPNQNQQNQHQERREEATQITIVSPQQSRMDDIMKYGVDGKSSNASPKAKKKTNLVFPPAGGAAKLKSIRQSYGGAPWQLPEGSLEVQGARFGKSTSSALASMVSPTHDTQNQTNFRDQMLPRMEDNKLADVLSSHDNLRESNRFSNLAQSKRHIYLRDLDPQIELKSSKALAPIVKNYRPSCPQSNQDIYPDEKENEKERALHSTKLSPIGSTHYDDRSKKKKTHFAESQRDSKNTSHYKTWMLKNNFATQHTSHGAFSVRDKNRLSSQVTGGLDVPIQSKFIILPSQQRGSKKKDTGIVEGINIRQLVSQQVDRSKLMGKQRLRNRPPPGVNLANRGTECVEDIIKKRNVFSPQTDKMFSRISQKESDRQRKSVQVEHLKDIRDQNMSPNIQLQSERISSMENQQIYSQDTSQYDKFEDMQIANDKIFKMNFMKKFPNAKVTKDFFKSRQLDSKNFGVTSGTNEVRTTRVHHSEKEERQSGSQDTSKAIQIISGVNESDSTEAMEAVKNLNEPYYLSLIKLKNSKEREDYNKRFKSARQGNSDGLTTDLDDSVLVGPMNQSLFQSVASQETGTQNLTPIDETQNNGLINDSIDSLQQMSKISYQKEKRVAQAFLSIEQWNMNRDEDVKALINVTGTKVSDKKQSVLDYFSKRIQDIDGIFKIHFPKRALERRFGLPQSIESLMHLIVETMQNDFRKMLNFFTQEKIVQNFQTQMGQKRLQDMIKTIEQYQKKEKDDMEFGKSMERVAGLKKLIEEYDQYDEIDLEKMELQDDLTSGCKNVLELAYMDLNRERGDIRGGDELDIKTLPFDKIEILMSKKTTMIQKRTALKVLERHFRRDPELAEASTQYNFFEYLEDDVEKYQKYIDEMKAQLEKMEEENKMLRRQIDDLQNQLRNKDKKIEELRHELLLATQQIGETKVEIVELTRKQDRFKEVIVEKEAVIQYNEEEMEKQEKELEDQNNKIQDLESEIQAKLQQLEWINKQLEDLQNEIVNKEKEYEAIQLSTKGYQEEITKLTLENQRLQELIARLEREAEDFEKRLKKVMDEAAKKKPKTPPPKEIEIQVPVEVPRKLVRLYKQDLDFDDLQVFGIRRQPIAQMKPEVTNQQIVMHSQLVQTSPLRVESEPKIEPVAQPIEPQGIPSADAHTQTRPVIQKEHHTASTQTIDGGGDSSYYSQPSIKGVEATTQTDKQKPIAKVQSPKKVVIASTPRPKEVFVPHPPVKPQTVDRACSTCDLYVVRQEQPSIPVSSNNSAFNFQQEIINDYIEEKSPLTNICVQKKVIESREISTQVNFMPEPVRFEQYAVLPMPSPQRSPSPLKENRQYGPPIYGFAYDAIRAGDSLQGGYSSEESQPKVPRLEDGRIPRGQQGPTILNDPRPVKRGKLIKGRIRAHKKTHERDNSIDYDPLVIDLKNKVPTHFKHQTPPKRGTSSSPTHKQETLQNICHLNHMFEMSRVITNSRAVPNKSTEQIAIKASSKGSSAERLRNNESYPEDSLFHPSQAPIKVHEVQMRNVRDNLPVKDQSQTTNLSSMHMQKQYLQPVLQNAALGSGSQDISRQNKDLDEVRHAQSMQMYIDNDKRSTEDSKQ